MTTFARVLYIKLARAEKLGEVLDRISGGRCRPPGFARTRRRAHPDEALDR